MLYSKRVYLSAPSIIFDSILFSKLPTLKNKMKYDNKTLNTDNNELNHTNYYQPLTNVFWSLTSVDVKDQYVIKMASV